MNSIKVKVYYFLTQVDCASAKAFLIAASYLWGIFLFYPGNSFDIHTHRLMEKIASETVWASAFMSYAILGTLISQRFFSSKYITLIESIIGFLIWTTAAVCIFMSTSQAPAVAAPHIIGACMSWWILIRTGLKHV